jgi:hypothetical protein
MKAFVFTLLLVALHGARADTTQDVVRIACVPEAGLLDIEYRGLHDSVAGSGAPGTQAERNAVLARAGFYLPRGLAFTCKLGDATYTITAQQDEISQRMCGESPEIGLTLTRGSEKLLSDVYFGESCHQHPSVMRITVGDGPRSWRGRETQVCYATGKDADAQSCDWTFGAQASFDKRFPLDQERVQKIVSREERR